MRILTAEFIRSCAGPEQFLKGELPEVAFIGRSNVGKSSLINSLLQRKGLAKVSRTPGIGFTGRRISGVVDGPPQSLLRRVRAVDADKDLLHHG